MLVMRPEEKSQESVIQRKKRSKLRMKLWKKLKESNFKLMNEKASSRGV